MSSNRTQAMRRGERGFNLLELLMSMSLATILFMAITTLYVKQGEVLQQQNDVLDMNREARFALEHLRRDLTSLGSNGTPNSSTDPLVCPKPDVVLRAAMASMDGNYVASPELNPGVRPIALTLFGSLDVKRRFRTASIVGNKVFLLNDATSPPPKNQDEYDQIFTTDRLLRVSGADGQMAYYHISGGSAGDNSVTVSGNIARQGEGQVCGYTGFGENYWVDVQGFVRYRVIGDTRPGAPTLATGLPERTLLVRERLLGDGLTTLNQTVLAENVVELGLYDVLMDKDRAPESMKAGVYKKIDNLLTSSGDGLLGNTGTAVPEALRALTVKLSVRSEWPNRGLAHVPRQSYYSPLTTFQLANDGRGTSPVVTLGTRVFLPTLVSRNL
jgi:prepilin-type N-terminal cleavage/methylation domain-containing protein